MHTVPAFADPRFFYPGLDTATPVPPAQLEAFEKFLEALGYDPQDLFEAGNSSAPTMPSALPFALDPQLLEAVRQMQQGLTQSDGQLRPTAPNGAQMPGAMGDIQLLIAILQMLLGQRQQQGPSVPPTCACAGHLGGQQWGGGPSSTQTTWSPNGNSMPAAVREAQVTAAPPGTQARANVPWISQFDSSRVQDAGPVACYRACRAMMAAVGLNQPAGTGNRIQVATAENGSGQVSVDPNGVQQGRAYIDRELDAGRPVTIGVSYKDAAYNVDNITDHFVVVNGRGVDEQGRTFYTFHDPGSNNGQDLKLYVDNATGNLVSLDGKRYEMSMVVPT